jgi:hypothetical protein
MTQLRPSRSGVAEHGWEEVPGPKPYACDYSIHPERSRAILVADCGSLNLCCAARMGAERIRLPELS